MDQQWLASSGLRCTIIAATMTEETGKIPARKGAWLRCHIADGENRNAATVRRDAREILVFSLSSLAYRRRCFLSGDLMLPGRDRRNDFTIGPTANFLISSRLNYIRTAKKVLLYFPAVFRLSYSSAAVQTRLPPPRIFVWT